MAKRERDPLCDVCGHNHVQGVKCQVCGHVGKYIVPGGPNRPNRGAIPPVPPGPIGAPNLTPPTIDGLRVVDFNAALQAFFDVLLASATPTAPVAVPPALGNFDQLGVVLETLPDYHPEDEQPSYVLAIECRPIARELAQLLPNLPFWPHVNWQALNAEPLCLPVSTAAAAAAAAAAPGLVRGVHSTTL